MFKRENKRERQIGLYEEIKKVLPDASAEEALCAFRFNLDKEEGVYKKLYTLQQEALKNAGITE